MSDVDTDKTLDLDEEVASKSKLFQVRALSPVFGHELSYNSFCLSAKSKDNIERLSARLAGTRDLVGLYIPQETEPDYNADALQYGRVIALVRMLRMPPGHSVHSYQSGCLEYRGGIVADRWPIGWPSEVVFYSMYGGPYLKDGVMQTIKPKTFGDFAIQFHLDGLIYLGPYPDLRKWLLREVLAQIRRDPTTQIRPF